MVAVPATVFQEEDEIAWSAFIKRIFCTGREDIVILLYDAKYADAPLSFLKNNQIKHQVLEAHDRVIIVLEFENCTEDCFHNLLHMEGFIKKASLNTPYPLVAREFRSEDTVVQIGDNYIGGTHKAIIAGPCSVESESQFRTTVQFLTEKGVSLIRGGLYKPRTSPYDFQGLREDGIALVKDIKSELNFHFVSEILAPAHIELLHDVVDIWQVGTRSMANYELLKALAGTQKPVMLKRGIMATIDEWLLAAEYLLKGGNENVILCERGIRSFEPKTRFTFDINAIPVIKDLSHLPIIADPSHAVGRRKWVPPLARAALVAGADGVIVEVHPDPVTALSDAEQSITFSQFESFMKDFHDLKTFGL